MSPIERIIAARTSGEVIAGTATVRHTSIEELAAEFGLAPIDGIYDEISAEEAVSVLETVIHKDMAYSVEIVSREEALKLADDFVSSFKSDEARFFTNGDLGRRNALGSMSWSPATNATFDTGVLVLGKASCACMWFKDED